MSGINKSSFEDAMLDHKRIKAKQATAQIQEKSAEQGLDKLTIEEIDAEIKKVRRERVRSNYW